jgi:hypothetical protein
MLSDSETLYEWFLHGSLLFGWLVVAPIAHTCLYFTTLCYILQHPIGNKNGGQTAAIPATRITPFYLTGNTGGFSVKNTFNTTDKTPLTKPMIAAAMISTLGAT